MFKLYIWDIDNKNIKINKIGYFKFYLFILLVILKLILVCDEGLFGGDCNEICGYCYDVK